MILNALLLLFSSHALSTLAAEKRVGCELNPCNQQCIDTADSYYCLCFKNWIMQPDQHTCVHEREEATSSVFLGCYAENSTNRDFTHRLWGRTDASVEECIHGCRSSGFRFAALHNGNECWCDKSHIRIHNTSTACNMPCVGSPGQMCGGNAAHSVYKVTRDNRYMGCYIENVGSPDLPTLAWDESTVASPADCILHCSTNNFLFAGIHNGGRCTCGNDFGKYGPGDEMNCAVTRCRHGWKEQNCGGNETNAIYRIIKGEYYGSMEKTDDTAKYASLPADLLSDFPHIQGMYTQRFAMYASDVVHAPFEDVDCFNGACYAPCGDIAKPDGFDRYRTDVVVRKFHIHLHLLNAEIDPTIQPERVFLYAETVVITESATFEFSLLIKARQIIIDYNMNPMITFNHEGPILGIDIDDAIHRGPPGDLTFQKQSWLCSRILMYKTEDTYNRVGWAIFDNLARESYFDEEQRNWLDGLRALKMEYTGIMRDGVHFAPYMSKSSLESQLGLYERQIALYDAKYTELLSEAESCNQFYDRADALLTIWIEGMLTQASIINDMVTDTMTISYETYNRIYAEYNASREELEAARIVFEEGIAKAQSQAVRRAMFGFIGDTAKIMKGAFPVAPGATITDIIKTGAQVSKDVLNAWGEAAENIAASVEAMEQMMAMIDAMMAGIAGSEVDWSQYEGSVEEVAGLYAAVEEWQVLRYMGDVLLDDPNFRGIEGCLGYQMAYFDTCNWGEALTQSAIEHAENMRRAIAATAIYDNKLEMQTRINAELAALGDTCVTADQVVITFAEQHYDIMIDANDALVTFCQAHYYESFSKCPDNTLPKFEEDLLGLRTSILAAIQATQIYTRKSPAYLDIEVVDDPEATADCKDWKLCPIKMFRDTRELIVNVPIDHRRFLDVDLFLVQEVRVFFDGIKTDSPDFEDQYVRMLVDVSGPFSNKNGEDIQTFVTRPMSAMLYEYELETEEVTLACALYSGNGNDGANVQHMSPYTTWHFRVHPANTWINVDDVTSAVVEFCGPFTNLRKPDLKIEPCPQ